MSSCCSSNFVVSLLSRPSLYVKLQEVRMNTQDYTVLRQQLLNSRRYKKLVDFPGEIWKEEKSKRIKNQYTLYRERLNALVNASDGNIEKSNNSIDEIKNMNGIGELRELSAQYDVGYFDFEYFLSQLSKEDMKQASISSEGTFTKIMNGLEQALIREIKEYELKVWKVILDGNKFPLNPSCFLSKSSTGMKGRGVLKKWGTNNAGDALITRRSPETNKLQIVLIERTDGSGLFAFPGGFVDLEELLMPVKAVIREFMEEAIGIKLILKRMFEKTFEGSKCRSSEDDELDNTLNVLRDIFGNFKTRKNEEKQTMEIYFEKNEDINFGRLVYAGYLDDERNTDNAWIETIAINWHLNASQAERLKVNAGDDAKPESARFYNIVNDPYLEERGIQPLKNLFASHSNILKRMLKLYFPEDLEEIV